MSSPNTWIVVEDIATQLEYISIMDNSFACFDVDNKADCLRLATAVLEKLSFVYRKDHLVSCIAEAMKHPYELCTAVRRHQDMELFDSDDSLKFFDRLYDHIEIAKDE